MTTATENRARVTLEALETPRPGPTEGWLVCRVRVVAAEDVAGYPNLLAADLPRELEALLPVGLTDRLGADARWVVEASLVGPGRLRVRSLP